uniref:GYF domain-containing protein n=1 Tax=Mesocestoides corti TaxID=53468 RepID=A0A5K3F3D4_MESCO
MEPTDSVFRYIYTKEELLQIRDEYMKHEDLVRFPVAPSIISLEPEVRLPYRKARPPKHVDVFFDANSQMPEDSPQRGGDECPGDPSQQPPSWRRSHRLSGGTPQSPLDSTGAPGNQRHNSGSSGGDDSGGCGAVRREFDWTLGCGKWRHRSTSGSERGNHKRSSCSHRRINNEPNVYCAFTRPLAGVWSKVLPRSWLRQRRSRCYFPRAPSFNSTKLIFNLVDTFYASKILCSCIRSLLCTSNPHQGLVTLRRCPGT